MAINRTRFFVARVDLQAGPITAVALGVGQKELETISAASGTGCLNETFWWGLFGGVGQWRVVGFRVVCMVGVCWVVDRNWMVDRNWGAVCGLGAVMGVGTVGCMMSKRMMKVSFGIDFVL